ncbi:MULTISPECIES: M23 family metallopeptidase [Desulfitobacterium]|uniref:Metalloendopeptidase-like membrane protein n=1 Tax=Desulfitobacterium dehalogenans (strain ATCC 51507 / DSM 9161 / JW/IU-DC1) TaxID=756499 RepID=I4AEM4_DESDJ|nr:MULTISPECIES: M23 family metallopeptidase [Desulfitobacterium]AFM02409.1 metalloendopeptidase-like membrane protein [Desulfitobacterium dehalogenans ATCC 51507]
MNNEGHGQRALYRKGCALLFMCCFWINAWSSDAFSQEEQATYSVVTLQEGQSLDDLAKKYQTTRSQILLDNPSVIANPEATLTIRENTVQEIPAVVEALSRGASLTWSWPVSGPISSDYGWRKGEFHHGIDFAIPHGTEILAAREGKVVKAQWIDIYGLTVLLDHGNGVQSLYAHNQKLLVRPGEWVEQGDRIALAGDTGRSTGPHLHFEIRLNGKAVDPKPYLPRNPT